MDSPKTSECGFQIPSIIITNDAGQQVPINEALEIEQYLEDFQVEIVEMVKTLRDINLNSGIQANNNSNESQDQEAKGTMVGQTACNNVGKKTFESTVAKTPSTKRQIPTSVNTGRLQYNLYDCIENFQIIATIGEGSFADVVKARHLKKRTTVAIKIKCLDEGEDDPDPEDNMIEAIIWEKLTKEDISDKIPFVKLLDYFDYNGHICLITDIHGMDLWTYQVENGQKPFPMEVLKYIVYQLLLALEFLHSKNIVHTDIKADNVLLDNILANKIPIEILTMMESRVRLTDFGSAVDYTYFDPELTKNEPIVQTVAYRAPEVFFRAGWDLQIDIWSLACIVLEFYNPSCKDIFDEDDTKVQLKIMELMFGKFPQRYTEGENANFFDKDGFILLDDHEKLNPFRYGPLKLYQLNKEDDDSNSLFDLLSKLFVHDPAERLTPTNGLTHPCFDSTKLKIGSYGLA